MQTNLAGLLALLILWLSAGIMDASAQESVEDERAAEIDELEPAVSSRVLIEEATNGREEIDPRQVSAGTSIEEGESEQRLPTTALAQDVRRRVGSNGVMDEIELGRTEITGNQELPKVLYIVPWKKSDPGNLMGLPVNTLLDEVLAPIDRSEFVRQVDYYTDLYGEEEE